jgi:hypothetical protein
MVDSPGGQTAHAERWWIIEVQIEARLTCPECGAVQVVEMPRDACQYFYTCTNCEALLRPKPGDCCVFCSYADVPCPPKQHEKQ